MLSWLKRLFRKIQPAVSIPETVEVQAIKDEIYVLESADESLSFKSFSSSTPDEDMQYVIDKRKREFLEWRENCKQVDELFRRRYAANAAA